MNRPEELLLSHKMTKGPAARRRGSIKGRGVPFPR